MLQPLLCKKLQILIVAKCHYSKRFTVHRNISVQRKGLCVPIPQQPATWPCIDLDLPFISFWALGECKSRFKIDFFTVKILKKKTIYYLIIVFLGRTIEIRPRTFLTALRLFHSFLRSIILYVALSGYFVRSEQLIRSYSWRNRCVINNYSDAVMDDNNMNNNLNYNMEIRDDNEV